MTVSQLLASISSREITEWQEYFLLVDSEQTHNQNLAR